MCDKLEYLTYRKKSKFIRKNCSFCLYIAALTINYARLRLYNMLDKLEAAGAYSDTDSLYYIKDERPKEAVAAVASALVGQSNEEIAFKGGKHLKFFAAYAPKNYETIRSDSVYRGKVKGMSADRQA